MNAVEQAQEIVNTLALIHLGPVPPVLLVEPLFLPSCGLMGDVRVYGYTWIIQGLPQMDTPPAKAFLKAAATRLTNEVRADDGTRFVRVFAEVTIPEE